MDINESVLKLNNIGEQRANLLNKLNIYTLKDLLEHFPRDYEDRSVIKKINGCQVGEVVTIKGKIVGKGESSRIGSLNITKIKVKDDTGVIDIVWYNQPYLKNNFYNHEFIFTGKVKTKYNRLQIDSPDYEVYSEEPLSSGRIVPIYPTTGKLSQKMIRKYIKDTLDKTLHQIQEIIPKKILQYYNLCDRKFAIKNIHFPDTTEAFFSARKRLVFEELLIIQLSIFTIKGIFKRESTNIKITDTNIETLKSCLPYKLTQAQENVMEQIKKDIISGNAMYRLIQGDVGSGKTAIAILTCFMVIKNGYQGIIMVPTEVLARQHYKSFNKLFTKQGINTVLLTGNLKTKEKLEVKEKIANGEAQMIVATHAILEENIKIKNLGIAITDEQHRFGVKQRSILFEKGTNPNVLVMSATPIPRTLALILHGDLDISIINELPPGRKVINTVCVNSTYKERIFNFIKKEVDNGRQVYIICPTIEESDTNDLKSVVNYTKDLNNGCLKNYNVQYLHGKMKNKEKQEIMDKFINSEIKIIVSTTVIEVGINVPNATVMLIENAERFGLSQLHQLRGRVGRGQHKSYCILITNSKNKTTKERMKAMVSTNDGFKISELDLKIRGPGDFFGTRQHGLPEMKIANLYKDIDILKQVQSISKIIYGNIINTNTKEYDNLKNLIKLYLNGKIHL